MEPLTLFAASIGMIGAIHLLSTAVERFGKGRYHQGNQQAEREDWYCFFHLSDLLGEHKETTEKRNTQPTLSDTEHREQIQRQQANRPRVLI